MTLTNVSMCSEPDCGLPIRSRGRCNKHYESHRSRMIAYGKWQSIKVDAAPVLSHYQELLAAGMSRNQVSRVSGVKADQLDNLVRPRKDRGDQPAKVVFSKTADRILAVPVPVPHQVWRTGADGQRVDPTGTARRLQALVAIGHTQRFLASRLGVLEANMPPIVNGTRLVTAGVARKVADLFDELQLTPGNSVRARNNATKRGWVSPLAWDEETIDDPDARPMLDGDMDADLDPVAVDRGVAWMHGRVPRTDWSRYQAWKQTRPPLTRSERIEVALRCDGEHPQFMLLESLSLRKSDLLEVAA